MPKDLNDAPITSSAHVNYSFEVPNGKTLRIETSPDGEEICVTTPPPGKKFLVQIGLWFALVDE